MAAKTRGTFITFEGLDGCGKTTQMEKLAAYLRQSNLGQGKLGQSKLEVVTTREPGGTAFGDRIRAILLDSRTAALDMHAELALMFASRAQHIHEVILPALHAGKIVLCDRFTDSSEAYQGGGRKLGSEPVLALHRHLCGGLQPDLTILMDCDVAGSVARARRRNLAQAGEKNKTADEGRFERENQAFFERVHRAFHEIARREPKRVVVIDARRAIGVVHSDIVKAVEARLGLPAHPHKKH